MEAGKARLRADAVRDASQADVETLPPEERPAHKLGKTPGALFVAIVKRACADRGIALDHSRPFVTVSSTP